MISHFRCIIDKLFCRNENYLYQASRVLSSEYSDIAEKIIASFLICLSNRHNPQYDTAKIFLQSNHESPHNNTLADFFLARLDDIETEIDEAEKIHPEFQKTLQDLEDMISEELPIESIQDKLWEFFFPEGVGVIDNKHRYADKLRNSRMVDITENNQNPITRPADEMIFTSNVLLTIPDEKTTVDDLNYTEDLKAGIKNAMNESQQYWYDHPVQIGVAPEANEIIYGLAELDKSLETERERGNLSGEKVKCVLSVSVTHTGLLSLAKDYIQQELAENITLKNLEVYIFTENNAQKLISEVFFPVNSKYFGEDNQDVLSEIFGVDGEYGRHYSFLKAIAAVWNVLIDNSVKATFKIDLDQVFPQNELIEETGASALEHFKTPLWGAKGDGNEGREVEFGMIAGGLVNEKDIHNGLFTPDVPFPKKVPDTESRIFFSKLLMALSTEGEVMTRYNENSDVDGKNTCLQRIHVTGGTNGILVDALRRYRPFTPTFIGRAEDQAYIISTLGDPKKQSLAYLHKAGLIMRHDKEAFAQEALKNAELGKIAGDYIRMLYFSEYARAVTANTEELKEILNPFTGSFISKIPITLSMLRFALKAADFFKNGEAEKARKFLYHNASRLDSAIDFIKGDESKLKKQVAAERNGWDRFYDILDKAEELQTSDPEYAAGLEDKAKNIITECRIR